MMPDAHLGIDRRTGANPVGVVYGQTELVVPADLLSLAFGLAWLSQPADDITHVPVG